MTGYPEVMTALLEKALHRLEALPPKEQDAIAEDILETLDMSDAHFIEAIQVGVSAAEEGRVVPAREALSQLQEKLGISG